MDEEDKGRLLGRLERVQQRYEGHGRVFRVVWMIAAVTVVLAGLAMSVFPGPAVVVIPVGLAMLAAQFSWARKLLTISIERGVDTTDRVQHASLKVKVLGGVALACLAGAAAATFLALR